MKKNQRKEVIDQIQDLMRTRGKVNVSNITTSGHVFTNDINVGQPEDIGNDTIIEWEVLSFIKDLQGEFPTHSLFLDLASQETAPINVGEKLSLSGLYDVILGENKLVRYRTWMTPSENKHYPISFSGKCKASVYYDGLCILRHEYDPGDYENTYTSTTTFDVPMIAGQVHRIEIVLHSANAPTDAAVKLESNLFQFLAGAQILDLEKPISTFATTGLQNSIRISWEQVPDINLNGGGVEIWAKHSVADDAYRFLDRVPFPASSYVQNSQIGYSNILPNPSFDDYVFPDGGDSGTIGNGTYGEGPLNWIFDYSEELTVELIATSGLGYNNYVSILNNNSPFNFLNTVTSYNLPITGDEDNLNTTQGVTFTYASTYYIRSETPEVCENITEADLVFVWEPDLAVENAEVQCVVYKNGSATTYTVDAIDGRFAYTLSAGEVASVIADPTYIEGLFRTSVALANGDSASTTINLRSIKLEYPQTSSVYANILYSDAVPVSYGEVLTVDKVTRGNGREYFSILEYSSDDELLYSSYSLVFNTISEDTWKRESSSYTITNPDTAYVVVKDTVVLYQFRDDFQYFDYQTIRLLKESTVQLSPQTEFSYKLRNYTSGLRYSEYTLPFNGSTSAEVYHMSITTDSDEVSHFIPVNINVSATTTLSSIQTEVIGDNGSSVDLDLYTESVNDADFIFRYKPLFTNCVLYDTFSTDYYNRGATAGIADGEVSGEASPARAAAVWEVPTPVNMVPFCDSGSNEDSVGFWPNSYPNVEDFQSYIGFYGIPEAGTYKNYDLSKTAMFYRGIFGNSDDPNGNYLFKDPANRFKFSFGMIINPGQFDISEPMIITKSDELFTVRVYPESYAIPGHALIEVSVKGIAYEGDPNSGSIVLTHTIPIGSVSKPSSDWIYFHASANMSAPYDNNQTYIRAYNISLSQAYEITNTATEVVINDNRSEVFKWSDVESMQLGVRTSLPTSSVLFRVDSVYLTCDTIKKNIIETNIAPFLAEERNPYYPSFGFKSGQEVVVHSEGTPALAEPHDYVDGEVPFDSGILIAEAPLTIDWNNPDGTMYILRDTYTINQIDIDNLTEGQPLYTYSRSNKLYVDMLSEYANTEYVRFSNDRSSWGEWTRFNNRILYPWELYEVGHYDTDGTDGGLREVYVQALTATGNSSNFWEKPNHRDTIYFNPLASVGSIESYNYLEGISGWSIGLNGSAEFNDVWIRGDAKISGRNLDSGLLNTSWVNGQLDAAKVNNSASEKRRVSSAYLFRGLFCYRNYEDTVNYTNFCAMEYCSDFALDINNEHIAYVPGISSDNQRAYVTKVDMRANDDAFPFTTGEHKNIVWFADRPEEETQAEQIRYLSHIAVDSSCMFIADCSTVYMVDKTTMEPIDSEPFPFQAMVVNSRQQTSLFGGHITGLSLCYSKDNTKNLYVFFGYRETEELAFNYGQTVVVMNPETFTVKQMAAGLDSLGNQPDSTTSNFAGNDFDCNGEYLIASDHWEHGPADEGADFMGGTHVFKLNDKGLLTNLFIGSGENDGTICGELAYNYSTVAVPANYANQTPLGWVKGQGGCKIFDNKLIGFTTPAKHNFYGFVYTDNYSNFIGSYDLRSIDIPERSVSEWTRNYTSTYFLPGSYSSPVAVKLTNSAFPVDTPDRLSTYINNSSWRQELLTCRVLYPFVGYEDGNNTWGTPATGYGVPAVVRNQLFIPFVSSWPMWLADPDFAQSSGTAILAFDIVGGGLNYKGVIENVPNEVIVSLKYDGKYLWRLSLDNTYDGAVDEDGVRVHQKLRITREIV